MGLGREEAIAGLQAEYDAFGAMIRSLNADQWEKASRCAGWSAGDVARHVTGTATDVANGVPGTHTPEEEVAERKGRTPAEIADELETAMATLRALASVIDDNAWNGPSPLPELTMRQGILTLIYDTYVHSDDIRAAIGLPTVDSGVGLDGSVEYVADQLEQRGWGPATLALDGMEKIDIGGGGNPVTGDAKQFVLVACGRADPAGLGLDGGVNIYADA
ncbi:MAG: maleylpyruvate isomerase family mycothiol-dependent enzyme [Acidimicrobiia bacterium]|nr:maleylpyruvate isomerase family mycothiol-dependent enzyme [Acidimicrobiia bacterium]